MSALADELRAFFVETGCKQSVLARLSDVPCSTISFLLSGKRRCVYGDTQDKLRIVMQQIRQMNKSMDNDAQTQPT